MKNIIQLGEEFWNKPTAENIAKFMGQVNLAFYGVNPYDRNDRQDDSDERTPKDHADMDVMREEHEMFEEQEGRRKQEQDH